MTIEQRLARLEAIEAIRQLKHRYLLACDAKDATTMRACFVDGPMHIDYGPVGVFDNADAVAKIFKELGCHPHIVEMHHGSNPQIDITDAHHARATWSLHYQQINTQTQVLTQLGAVYEDEYLLGAQGWRISRTVCRPLSTLVLELGEQAMKALVRGRP
jgi:hypothetical protein